jgi:hypothetical protein
MVWVGVRTPYEGSVTLLAIQLKIFRQVKKKKEKKVAVHTSFCQYGFNIPVATHQ